MIKVKPKKSHMKNKTILLSIFVLAMIKLNACKEEQVLEKNPPVENFVKLKRFVSISAGIPESDILYNESTNEFYVSKGNFRMKFEEVQQSYSIANVYKFNHEKN
jgi:hypothetical protein